MSRCSYIYGCAIYGCVHWFFTLNESRISWLIQYRQHFFFGGGGSRCVLDSIHQNARHTVIGRICSRLKMLLFTFVWQRDSSKTNSERGWIAEVKSWKIIFNLHSIWQRWDSWNKEADSNFHLFTTKTWWCSIVSVCCYRGHFLGGKGGTFN